MMRAAAVAGAGQIVRPRLSFDRVFRDLAEAVAEADREAQAKVTSQLRERLMLGPADHRDRLTAMAWFAALNPTELRDPGMPVFSLVDEQKVLIWRAERLSFIHIKNLLGLSHRECARRLYTEAIEMIWRAANGRQVYPHVATMNQIKLLQTRDRAYHNRERQYA